VRFSGKIARPVLVVVEKRELVGVTSQGDVVTPQQFSN
jgi:hypothetical protein